MNASYDIMPVYDEMGQKLESKGKKIVWKNVSLNGPSPINNPDRRVSAVGKTTIIGEIVVMSCWFSSNGFCLVGYEDGPNNMKRHQEWWCVPHNPTATA